MTQTVGDSIPLRDPSTRRITMATARRLFLACQGLDGAAAESAECTVERLGYVQIDTIAVVQRAHHHTLWSRRGPGGYDPAMLHELQAVSRRVFEYWTHAASYVPMNHYRYYVPRMRGWADSPRARAFLDQNAPLVREVTARIRAEGPLRSADFKAPPGRKPGPWWDWKPAKHALEMLFSTGEFMVTERRNFQRIYDLAERVLPAGLDTTPPPRREIARFGVRRALKACGFADVAKIRWGWGYGDQVPGAIEELVASGEVVPVRVAGLGDTRQYCLTADLDRVQRRRRRAKRLHILSPFDNLVIDRRRLKAVFGFDCKLECYTPAAKRKYGYFCLPILWGDEFIGRLDPKADRKRRTLIVRKLMFEPDVAVGEPLLAALAAGLAEFAAFNDCDRVVVERTRPTKLRAAVRRAM